MPDKPRPRIRLVHPGGPAANATVYLDDHYFPDVTEIDIHLDATTLEPTQIRLTVLNDLVIRTTHELIAVITSLDITGELAPSEDADD